MDLQQNKLSKEEWESIEIPSVEEEKNIYKLIIKGFHNINIKENKTLSILSFLKLPNNELMNNYIFLKYIQPEIIIIYKKYKILYNPLKLSKKTLNKADIIRFNNMENILLERKKSIFEFILLEYIIEILKNKDKDTEWIKPFYTLKKILKNNILYINNHLLNVVLNIFSYFEDAIDKTYLISNAKSIILSNYDLIQYSDKSLFSHQKELFTKVKSNNNKLIFYIAPTGTGKTLSPLGISESYKIIFVCAVRHIGLALAKAAITIEKCVAFAFGCNDIEDIRLHYFSAKEYSKNNKTGGIFKVDNSIGDKVEIMISDIKSYLFAMHYMLAFNNKNKIILYWDEPTITLDYEEHEFHDIIKNNWDKNLIPNIILSSATLPPFEDLKDTINSYKSKFGGEINFIKNFDCSKSISIINREGYTEAPHYLSEDYLKIIESVKYIENNKTILRYVDLSECIKFICYINKNKFYKNDLYSIDSYLTNIEDVTIDYIKIYYLILMKNINPQYWYKIFNYFKEKRTKRYISTTYISTEDAHTLTNGPTIYITQDINKIAFFCIQSINIPQSILKDIYTDIEKNSEIINKIEILERNFEDGLNKEDMKDNKIANNRGIPSELRILKEKIESLKLKLKIISLPEIYIPNTKDHLIKWNQKNINNAFRSDISEQTVEKIIQINDIDDKWKLLLLMGIGVFSVHSSSKYTEIMKDLAKSKKLYIIIASSDFIYGTNYQFDHCYLGKDLLNMTQEKIIQALGRVGRNKISDEYTIRVREDNILNKIFNKVDYNPEVINMKKLFS